MSISGQVITSVDTGDLDTYIARMEKVDALIVKYAALIEAAMKRYVAVKTGALRASITTHLEAMAAEVTGGEGLDYGRDQEYGNATQPGTPYLRPAFERYGPAFLDELAAIFN